MGKQHVVELSLTDTRIAPVRDDGSAERWSATVTLTGHSPSGTVSDRGSATGLRALAAAFRANPEGSRALGEALRRLLLPASVEQALFDGCLSLLRPEDILRLRIHCADPVFTALPWELTRAPFPPVADAGDGSHRMLHLVNRSFRCVVSRVTVHGALSGPKGALRTVVASAAEAYGKVREADGRQIAEPEQKTLGQKTEESTEDARWAADTVVDILKGQGPAGPPLPRADRDGLTAALCTTTEIVCLIANGWAESADLSGIVLHGSNEDPELLTAGALADLFYEAGTQLVVLVCCNTAGGMESFEGWGNTAEQLTAKVPAVVAMQSVVEPRIGHDFLVGLVRGLSEHGEIHAAMAEGHKRIAEYDMPGYMGVPALYTGPNGLQLRDPQQPSRPGLPYGYPVDALDRRGAEGRRARLDVVWGLDRRPFAGVLLDSPHNDLADDLNRWEAQWDGALVEGGVRPRRWFRVDITRPPRPDSGTGVHRPQDAVHPRSQWTEFRRDFPGRSADHGWIVRLDLPAAGGAWSSDDWRTAFEGWLPLLLASDGRLDRPVVVVLRGTGPSLRAWGVTALEDVRDHLASRFKIPVTALSRHRPGRVQESAYANGTADTCEPFDETGLLALRATNPTRYQQALARLAADTEAHGRRAMLAVAADYDDDIRTWLRAAHESKVPLPRRHDLAPTFTAERADTVVLALLEWHFNHPETDLSTWDELLLTRPVRPLFRQYRDVWREQPAPHELALWLAAHPSAAPAAARAGLTAEPSAVLGLLPATTAPWSVLLAFGIDAGTLRLLFRLPAEQRDAVGLVKAKPKEGSPAPGHEATLRTEHIRAELGRSPMAVPRPPNGDKARR